MENEVAAGVTPDVDEIVKMVAGETPRYERVGECVRCGVCCLNEDCGHFEDATDDTLARCRIFGDPARSGKCVDFPYAPPIACQTCGFRFTDRVDGRVLGYKEL